MAGAPMSYLKPVWNSKNSNNSSDLDRNLDSQTAIDDSRDQHRSLTTEEWLDSVQAAAYLKISIGALRNMTSNGQLPYHKLGKRNRYRTEELRELLLSQKRGVSYGN